MSTDRSLLEIHRLLTALQKDQQTILARLDKTATVEQLQQTETRLTTRINTTERVLDGRIATQTAHSTSELTKTLYEAVGEAEEKHKKRWDDLKADLERWKTIVVQYSREVNTKIFKSCECGDSQKTKTFK